MGETSGFAGLFFLMIECESMNGKTEEMRGMFLNLGYNMWSDVPVKSWGNIRKEDLGIVTAADHLRCDADLWRRATDRMAALKFNAVVIDLGEGCFYPSHPELAVKGTWSVDKMRKEIARLRGLGIEPIPKINFSTSHDTWLKEYGRMVSTPYYYKVCADVIRDVCEIFDRPRFLHLRYDEESFGHQSKYAYGVVRKGDLWFDLERIPAARRIHLESFLFLEKAGFDQVPCGSNWACNENISGLVGFCRKHIAPERLKSFLMTAWEPTLPGSEPKLVESLELAAAAYGQ
jgi:hypothetical protein